MNLRNVLRAYGLLRQLSDDESALLNILRALNDNDREQLVASMSDKPQKKSSKKAAGGGGKSRAVEFCGKCGTPKDRPTHNDRATSDYHPFKPSKSKHASSLQQQIGNRDQSAIRPPATATDIDDGNTPRCQAKRGDNRLCMLPPDHNIHHLTTANEYHEFQSLPSPRCAFRVTDIERCSAMEDDPIHDAATNPETYHEFQPPASSAAGASGD